MTIKDLTLLCYIPDETTDNRFNHRIKNELYTNLETRSTIHKISQTFGEITKNLNVINICASDWKLKLNKQQLIFNYTYFDVFKEAIKPVLYLEENGYNYVGATPKGYYLASDKELTKILVSNLGFKTPKYVSIFRKVDLEEADEISRFFSGSKFLVIKPNNEEASVGLRLVENTAESIFDQIANLTLTFPTKYLIEEYIEGFDVTVPLLGRENPEILLPLILEKKKGFHDGAFIFSADLKGSKRGLKWGNAALVFTNKTIDEINAVAKSAFVISSQRDFTRVDLRVTEEGQVYFLEINPNPQLNPVGGSFVDAATLLNVPFHSILQKMCNH